MSRSLRVVNATSGLFGTGALDGVSAKQTGCISYGNAFRVKEAVLLMTLIISTDIDSQQNGVM